VVTSMPTWREVQLLVARELSEPVSAAGPLAPARRSAMTWAARGQRTGPVVVKLRHGDYADEKTQWCAAHLPALGARGYPVPVIRWHGLISPQWHVTVQSRLPGRPLFALDGAPDGPLLDALTACSPGRLRWPARTGCAAWSATGRSPGSPFTATSARRTAVPSGMRRARRSRPSSTGCRRPAGPEQLLSCVSRHDQERAG
jgi:hypothetical protein